LRLLDDAELRRHMGEQARAHVERRFNWDEAVRSIRALYQDIVEARKR